MPPDNFEDTAAWVSQYFLTTCYGCLIVVCAARYMRLSSLGFGANTPMIRRFCLLTVVGALFRGLYFGIPSSVFRLNRNQTPHNEDSADHERWFLQLNQFTIFVISNIAFYCQFVLIVYFWANAYYSTRGQHVQQGPFRAFKALITLFICTQVCSVVVAATVNYYTGIIVHATTDTVLTLCAASSYIYFSFKLRFALTPHAAAGHNVKPKIQAAMRTQVFKIKFVARVCFFCALLRAILEVYEVVVVTTGLKFPGSVWWFFIFCEYFTRDIFASCAILYVLRRRGRTDKRTTVNSPYGAVAVEEPAAPGSPPSTPLL